jgi:hypothetical protein
MSSSLGGAARSAASAQPSRTGLGMKTDEAPSGSMAQCEVGIRRSSTTA